MDHFRFTLAFILFTLYILGNVKSLPTGVNSAGIGPTIVGGTTARQGQFPYQLEIIWNINFCGATLVEVDGIQIAITSGRCVIPGYWDLYTIVAGEQDWNSDSGLEQTREVVRAVVHPDIDYYAKRNDIAILFLNESFTLNENVKPIALPQKFQEITEGNITISGWGVHYFGGENSDLLYYVEIPVIDNESCNITWSNTGFAPGIIPSQLCAGEETGSVSACDGDIGGPATYKNEYLAGIVSFGYACGHPTVPGVYTKVSHLVDWVEEVVQNYKNNASTTELH